MKERNAKKQRKCHDIYMIYTDSPLSGSTETVMCYVLHNSKKKKSGRRAFAQTVMSYVVYAWYLQLPHHCDTLTQLTHLGKCYAYVKI